MNQEQKLLGEQRRQHLLDLLKQSSHPLTGTALADETGVSRQVIVQDIALLRARNEPIMATPNGYLYFQKNSVVRVKRVIACRHTFEETEKELNLLVDHGVKIMDVIVEHPIYGEITGSLMIESRRDVKQFISKISKNEANLLSSLTGGVHLHTLEAPDEETLDQACDAMEKAGFLLKKE